MEIVMTEPKSEQPQKIRDPDWISPEGLPWWRDKSASYYARVLPKHEVWFMQDANGEFQYVLINNGKITPDGKPVIEFVARDIDQMGKYIDRKAFENLMSNKNGSSKH